MTPEEQADAFARAHPPIPRNVALELAHEFAGDPTRPWCVECADWHLPDEGHSTVMGES